MFDRALQLRRVIVTLMTRTSPMSNMVPSLQPRGRSASHVAPTAAKKTKRTSTPTTLSDEELRRRIFANASVLFPSSSSQSQYNAYEIVYGTRPRVPAKDSPPQQSSSSEDYPFQYAMLVRRTPSGEFTPLMRGQAWSGEKQPWSMALQGLLDVTATAIHKKLGGRTMPPLGISEELPSYEPGLSRMVTQ